MAFIEANKAIVTWFFVYHNKDPENHNAGCGHYPLFSRKNNTCSCTLFERNYCSTGRIYLSLDTDKMCLLLM